MTLVKKHLLSAIFCLATFIPCEWAQAKCDPNAKLMAGFVNFKGPIGSCDNNLYFPDGKTAFYAGKGNWYHANGNTAFYAGNGTLYYENGNSAGQPGTVTPIQMVEFLEGKSCTVPYSIFCLIALWERPVSGEPSKKEFTVSGSKGSATVTVKTGQDADAIKRAIESALN